MLRSSTWSKIDSSFSCKFLHSGYLVPLVKWARKLEVPGPVWLTVPLRFTALHTRQVCLESPAGAFSKNTQTSERDLISSALFVATLSCKASGRVGADVTGSSRCSGAGVPAGGAVDFDRGARELDVAPSGPNSASAVVISVTVLVTPLRTTSMSSTPSAVAVSTGSVAERWRFSWDSISFCVFPTEVD